LEEHHVAEMVLRELDRAPKADEKWKAKLMVFKEIVEHHIEEEEGKIFAQAERTFDEDRLNEIFESFHKNKQSLTERMQKRSTAAA
jgi:hemerythrin-like domain-containing protein